MQITRRSFWSLIPGTFLLASEPAEGTPLASVARPFERMEVRRSNGAEYRAVLRGKTPTGEAVEVHETTLPPGGAPHRPHSHVHNEMWLIRDGTIEITVKGQSERLGPGSAAFVASNEEHGIRNAGDAPATYFVVAIGPGVEKRA